MSLIRTTEHIHVFTHIATDTVSLPNQITKDVMAALQIANRTWLPLGKTPALRLIEKDGT